MIATDAEQLEAVVRIVREVLGGNVVGVYLHGSTGIGQARPTSDLDVLVVVRQSTSEAERRALVTRIPGVSGSPEPRKRWRPVELTMVRQSAVNPWRYPPEREMQYGQWDRERYLAGFVPTPEPDPDLAVLITAALCADRAVVGPPAAAILAPVPAADLRQAVAAGVPGLVANLESDTRNVLLTLARIWLTLATGEIASKDEAAAWAIDRLGATNPARRAAARDGVARDALALARDAAARDVATREALALARDAPARDALALAREQYLAGTHGETAWAREMPAAKAAARAIVDQIARQPLRGARSPGTG